MTSVPNAAPVLVFVHPAWPWQFQPETRSDFRRLSRYGKIIEAAQSYPGPVILVDAELEVIPGQIVQQLDRLRERADFIALDFGDTDRSLYIAGKKAAKRIAEAYADRPVIIGGFYRNLCVKTVRRALPAAKVERVLCPGRNIC